MFDQTTLKLNVDPLIMSALREDITSEDVRNIVDEYLTTIDKDASVEIAFFGGSFSVLILTNLTYFLQQVVSLAETVVFLMLALKALKMDTISVPVVDGLITKHMD